jgi:hypothetical protein
MSEHTNDSGEFGDANPHTGGQNDESRATPVSAEVPVGETEEGAESPETPGSAEVPAGETDEGAESPDNYRSPQIALGDTD